MLGIEGEPIGITVLPPIDRRRGVEVMSAAIRAGVSVASTKVPDDKDPYGRSQIIIIGTEAQRSTLIRRAILPRTPTVPPIPPPGK